MLSEDFFKEGEDLPPEEPDTWRPPVPCPKCQSPDTRLVTMRYERLVYTCERCECQFEMDVDG